MRDITTELDQWPVAEIEDISLQLVHYKCVDDAQKAWQRRAKRINYENLYIIFNDRNEFDDEMVYDFEKLQYKNKICFTSNKEIAKKSVNCYYLKKKDPDNQNQVFPLMGFTPKWFIKRTIDDFDYVNWFNGNVNSSYVDN